MRGDEVSGPATMRLRLVLRSTSFRWLWLKYVTGFDARYHCERCLRGKRSDRLQYRQSELAVPLTVEFDLTESTAPYVYLCGVTPRYDLNLHVAFRPDPDGSEVLYSDDRVDVRITNAAQLRIPPLEAPLPAPFLRCRNFQFGAHVFGLSDNVC